MLPKLTIQALHTVAQSSIIKGRSWRGQSLQLSDKTNNNDNTSQKTTNNGDHKSVADSNAGNNVSIAEVQLIEENGRSQV